MVCTFFSISGYDIKSYCQKEGFPSFLLSPVATCLINYMYTYLLVCFSFLFFKWCIWVVKSSIFNLNLSTCLYIYLLARVSNLFKKHCTVKKKMCISYLNNHWLVIFLKENRLRSKLRFWYDFFKSINYYLVKKNFDF